MKKYITKTFGHRSVFGEDCSVSRTILSICYRRLQGQIMNQYLHSFTIYFGIYATDSEHSVRLRIDTRFNPELVRS